jgi:hypothetical protein
VILFETKERWKRGESDNICKGREVEERKERSGSEEKVRRNGNGSEKIEKQTSNETRE